MSNPRGEVQVTLGGRSISLRPTLACLLNIEEATGKAITDLAQEFASHGVAKRLPPTKLTLQVLHAAIRRVPGYEEITWDGFLELVESPPGTQLSDLHLASSKLIYGAVMCGREPKPLGEEVKVPPKAEPKPPELPPADIGDKDS